MLPIRIKRYGYCTARAVKLQAKRCPISAHVCVTATLQKGGQPLDTIVSMQEFFPWTWLLHLVRAIISFNVIHTLLKDKYNTFVTFLAIVLPSMLYSWVSLSLATRANETLVMATYYVFQFLLCYIVTEGKLFAKILATFLSFAAYLFGNIVFAFLSSLAFGWDVTIWLST